MGRQYQEPSTLPPTMSPTLTSSLTSSLAPTLAYPPLLDVTNLTLAQRLQLISRPESMISDTDRQQHHHRQQLSVHNDNLNQQHPAYPRHPSHTEPHRTTKKHTEPHRTAQNHTEQH